MNVSGSLHSLPPLNVPHDAKEWAGRFLKERGAAPEDIVIVVNPNAGELALERRWPKEHFARLIRILDDKYGAKIFLIGGTGEEEYTGEIIREAGATGAESLVGKISVPQFVALLSRANLMITNDSGPLHLACAAGTPTISFFGPETPVLYGPLGDNHRVFFEGIDCSPCINALNTKTARCRRGYSDCLARISPDDVVDAVNAFLDRSRRSGIAESTVRGDS
jgi:ADP-heptose:LPS heptosyltransferase